MVENLIIWLEENMMSCQSKAITGLDCFGCGLQRSLILLLKGDLAGSFLMYPPLVPLVGMILFLLIHLKMKFDHGAAILKILFISNAVLMILNVVLKNFI